MIWDVTFRRYTTDVSLISVQQRKAFPIVMEQVEKNFEETAEGYRGEKRKIAKRSGKPKGSFNKNRHNLALSKHLLWMQAMLRNMLHFVGDSLPLAYFVYDNV